MDTGTSIETNSVITSVLETTPQPSEIPTETSIFQEIVVDSESSKPEDLTNNNDDISPGNNEQEPEINDFTTDNITEGRISYESDGDDVEAFVRTKTRKRVGLLESDDDLSPTKTPESDKESIHSVSQEINLKKRKIRLKIVDSDSDVDEHMELSKTKKQVTLLDSDDDLSPSNKPETDNELKSQKYRLNIVDSDSEVDEEEITQHNKSFADENYVKTHAENALYDPPTSDEETVSKPPEENPEKPLIVTGRDAAKVRKEITSERQRRIRETDVSLPYHKPKPRTLKEFLSRRPKLAASIQGVARTPPSVAIKMSVEQLAEISEKLRERTKEVEEFYKSESEEEEPENPTVENCEKKEDDMEKLEPEVRNDDKAKEEIVETTIENNPEIPDEQPELNPTEIPATTTKPPIEYNLDNHVDVHLEENSTPTETSEVDSGEHPQQKLPKELASFQPKLSGDPDGFIDLETGEAEPNEVTKFMERFLNHTTKKLHHKHKVQMNILSVTSGEIQKEIVAINVDENEDDPALIQEKPGEKIKKLRSELQSKMAQRRSEIWQQRNLESSNNKENDDDVYDGETSECGIDLDDEAEMTDEIDSEEEYVAEEEPDEDDYEITDSPPKSAFIDGEAEDEDEIMESDSDSKLSENIEPRTLKRVLKGFTEDSDEEEQNDYDASIPPAQAQVNNSPERRKEPNRNSSEFLTPVSYLDGLKKLNSTSKRGVERTSPQEPSPLKDSNWQSDLQKKLYGSDTGVQSEDDLQDICPLETQPTQADLEPVEDMQPSTQDLLDICSGKFTGITQLESQTINTQEIKNLNTQPEIKNLDESQDLIISQLLDVDELEQFQKKFDTQIEGGEVEASGGVIDSDDEEGTIEVRRKQKQKLEFSDEESDDDDDLEQDEEINLHDVDDEREVGYDSEENEIIVTDNKLKISDFVEDEAELTESEWGSADEDENEDMDKLEFEQGDTETYDENQVRSDLEKIHMRRMLDDDTREVKILQELLLDDGELHGAGRQRQFRWKNIDSQTEEEQPEDEEEKGYMDEEDSEEQWRKQRHEREMFLKEKQAKLKECEDDITELSVSKVVKSGLKVIRRTATQPAVVVGLQHQRGSFLNRSSQVLERLAEMSKVSEIVGAPKNSKNFVFQTVTAIQSSVVVQDKKRKAADGTPNVVKKLRLSANFSPGVDSGRKKTERAKNLFGR